MKFARYVFLIAGVYGLLVMFPLYFMEEKLNIDYPPAMTHLEYYYSFTSIVLVCQVLFLFISWNPLRFRPFMVFAVFEKLSLVPTFVILFPQGRFPAHWIPAIIIDLTLCVLFLVSYMKTKESIAESSGR